VEGIVAFDPRRELYRIKWKGYPSSSDTWEPRDNLKGCARLLEAFELKSFSPGRGAGSQAAASRRA
jgi:hypothetical protein